MNERIRELAEQAFTAVGTPHDSITHRDQSVLDKNDTITVYTFTQNTMDEFAELIIAECVKHITDQQDLVETNWGCKHGIHIVYSLKEHFGVEE